MNEAASKKKKVEMRASQGDVAIAQYYREQLSLVPGLVKLLGSAILVSPVKSASDYSYSASFSAGPGYRIIGDAAGECSYTPDYRKCWLTSMLSVY